MIFLGYFTRSTPEPAPTRPVLLPEDEARAARFHGSNAFGR